jgi:hypothetical protein
MLGSLVAARPNLRVICVSPAVAQLSLAVPAHPVAVAVNERENYHLTKAPHRRHALRAPRLAGMVYCRGDDPLLVTSSTLSSLVLAWMGHRTEEAK